MQSHDIVFPFITKVSPWRSAPHRSAFTSTWCPHFTAAPRWASWCRRLPKNPTLTWPGWPWPAWLSSSQVRSSIFSQNDYYWSELISRMKGFMFKCSDQNDESRFRRCREIMRFPTLTQQQYNAKDIKPSYSSWDKNYDFQQQMDRITLIIICYCVQVLLLVGVQSRGWSCRKFSPSKWGGLPAPSASLPTGAWRSSSPKPFKIWWWVGFMKIDFVTSCPDRTWVKTCHHWLCLLFRSDWN